MVIFVLIARGFGTIPGYFKLRGLCGDTPRFGRLPGAAYFWLSLRGLKFPGFDRVNSQPSIALRSVDSGADSLYNQCPRAVIADT